MFSLAPFGGEGTGEGAGGPIASTLSSALSLIGRGRI
jgi:hypothetical protein